MSEWGILRILGVPPPGELLVGTSLELCISCPA